jgi:hypothetical protein
MEVHGYMVPFNYIDNTRRTTKERHVSRDLFDNVVISVRHKLIEIAKLLSLEIRERFPRDELLEAMSMVYPKYRNNLKCQPTLKHDFVEKFSTLVDHFCKKVEIHGE